MNTAVILGAGFSKKSGIPLKHELSQYIISDVGSSQLDMVSRTIIKKFLSDVFGYCGTGIAPSMDDILACIDIAAGAGHNMGNNYTPVHLRAVRHFIMYRLFYILDECFKTDGDLKLLVEFFERFPRTGYVVLNWDTVLERYIMPGSRKCINYCNGGRNLMLEDVDGPAESTSIAKVHGSSNWLYCSNCRAVLNDMGNFASPEQKAGFDALDIYVFNELKGLILQPGISCPVCSSAISSHIFMPGCRKSFKGSVFPNVWNEAEKILADSQKWIFIGYSLPETDYEFKHLLKLSELKLEHISRKRLGIDVVLLNDSGSVQRYKSFFGRKLEYICNNGIEEYLGRQH